MTNADHKPAIANWIAAANSHDPRAFLAYFDEDAVLDDPSVGEQFDGHDGIAEYFTRYFIGYNTTTELVSVTPQGGSLHVVVVFSGDFPGGRTGGIFNLTFHGEKISFAHADLT
ncbi:hypothetical protein AXA44_43755 [Rhodococcus sp. SC4]|jgi:ketosteroid isomerase-like protein|nr:hypothetical protein AXA44_43755 [Rhodococcus sp. SC4]